MPLDIGFAYQNTSTQTVVDDAWTSLIGGPTQLLGLTVGPVATLVELKGYVLNLSKDEARTRIVVDGTEVAQGSPENPLMYVAAFPTTTIGFHTVDFQAIALECAELAFAGPVGFTAIDFITITA
jgi:hypothetical protein